MTAVDLVKAAAAVRTKWHVRRDGSGPIRTADGTHRCPIQAVAIAAGCPPHLNLGAMARFCGLSRQQAGIVIAAADRDVWAGGFEGICQPIRHDMIRTLDPVVRDAGTDTGDRA